KSNALTLGLIFALWGVVGAYSGYKILALHAITDHAPPYLGYFAAHPRRAAATVLAMIALLSGVWAGLGVDGTVRWIAESVVLTLGTVARRAQSGQLQQYLFATAAALVAILFFVVLRGQG